MKFVHPEFLWAFAVLAIPVIIHLFNFRKYKVLYFPSLSFLKFVDQQTRSTQKLKHYLVLALRLLAFSLLIFAFAQPFIPAESSTKGGKPVIALYLDNSFSMTAKGTEGELISEA
ncbi:MAG: BatA domain-containing protein [Crocinitomicaceae bacterium]|nr:BatA domain-containing protein [Crocinitomicaceae bacterium]